MGTLAVSDFSKAYEQGRLGRLTLPNGRCWESQGDAAFQVPFSVHLQDLYELSTGTLPDGTSKVPPERIVSILAFGSAVRFPGFQTVGVTRRRWMLFGEEVTRSYEVPLDPSDADFLVVVDADTMTRPEVRKAPVGIEIYECGPCLREGGIHVAWIGLRELTEGARDRSDTVCASALREGVAVFGETGLGSRAGLARTTPYGVSWTRDRSMRLQGRIG